jgi:ammonium transporter, Amt family
MVALNGGCLVTASAPLTPSPDPSPADPISGGGSLAFASACFLLMMQAGFALLEAGAVRTRNTTNIITKNTIDFVITALTWWLVGYGIAFGDGNGFLGLSSFATDGQSGDGVLFVVQCLFTSTSTGIISGAMAERTNIVAFFVLCVVHTAIVYPFYAHWMWGPLGWLGDLGAIDTAGSSVVHMTGGVATLMGAIFLGPRLSRFHPVRGPVTIPGHSTALFALGGLTLWVSFLPFNVVSLGTSLSYACAGLVSMNSLLSSTAASLTSILLVYHRQRRWSLIAAINGLLVGMVAICSGCAHMYPWGAVITGVVAGVILIAIPLAMERWRIDDPLDATAVHLGGGVWGMLATALFSANVALDQSRGRQLGVQLLACVSCVGWSALIYLVFFKVVTRYWQLRVRERVEIEGLDITTHGEPSYPEFLRMQRDILAHGDTLLDVEHTMREMRDVTTQGSLHGAVPDDYGVCAPGRQSASPVTPPGARSTATEVPALPSSDSQVRLLLRNPSPESPSNGMQEPVTEVRASQIRRLQLPVLRDSQDSSA